MKKIIAILTAVVIVNSIASAELFKNFKHKGTIEINAYNVNNADFDKDVNDKVGDVDTRLMLDMTFDFNDDVSGTVSIVKNNIKWGTVSEDINTIENNVFVEQAYLNLKGVMGMDHKIGRQYYGNPNDLVIYFGPRTWPYQVNIGFVNALDAWTGVYKYNDWTFTGLLGKVVGATGDLGVNINGIDIKKKIDKFDLNAYYYYWVDNTVSPADKLGLAGIRANWECKFVKDLMLGLEYDKNMGSNNTHAKYKGYAYKANADYKIDLAGKLGLMAEYAYLSGQDSSTDVKLYTPISRDYRPGIIANGYGIDTTTYLNNIGTGYKGLHFGVNWTPEKMDKLNIAATYYNMKVAEKNTNYKDTIGNELDLVATWNHSDNVAVKGYYAMFKPEKDNVVASGGTKDDPQTILGVAFVVKF